MINATSGEVLQASAIAQGYQSQQQLKVMVSSQVQIGNGGMNVNAHKSPSSYMSEESTPSHMILEQKKVKFYAQIEQIKETRLIENLASLKTKGEKQQCIVEFSEIFEAMMKNVIEISEVVKQIRLQEPAVQAVLKVGTLHSNTSGYPLPTGSTQNPQGLNAGSSINPQALASNNQDAGNKTNNANNTHVAGEQKVQIDIADLPDQIIKDCKSIHNIYADIVQESSLKHLELCCETFLLDGSAINLKFKISAWYADIKDHVERHRPAVTVGKNGSSKGSSSKSFCSLLCPCFGSKSKTTVNNNNNQQINRAYTSQAIRHQRTTQDPPN